MRKTLRYRLLHRLRRVLGLRRDDDFDWMLYDHKYRQELEELEREFTLILAAGDYELADGSLRQASPDKKPLHPNARLLYETIVQLQPASVREFGCGGGDHLANLCTLLPGLEARGLDRARGQLAVLAERHPALVAHVRQHDIAEPLGPDDSPVDVSYTQAVLMHIHTGDAHLRGLEACSVRRGAPSS
ncbi:MAG: class I SAM-dependent methyltransferase [Planctomycetota bacterium]|nr:class I SAM-dependent methyltransferase [Planctomycetota bacterium]